MSRLISKRISNYLGRHEWALVTWAGVASFVSYCCMYMYRKPYTAATFADQSWIWADYKIALVVAQVIGYALSKFVGIMLISELEPKRRGLLFLGLIVWAEIALIGFALTPSTWGVFWLFLNGLPLGMIWGIVFSYLEGRKWTEILTVMISANFIFSSGLAKSIGSQLLILGFSGQSMPMVVGLLFFPLLLVSLWMLLQIPPPSADDQRLRFERKPMDARQRVAFFKRYALMICLFVAIYLLLTIVRDVRDNFAVEIWAGLGFTDQPSVFVLAEIPVAIAVFALIGLTAFIKNNQRALFINLLLTLLGGVLLITTTWWYQQGELLPVSWMIISGAGLFVPYILFNGIIFDRFIGTLKVTANVGFLMYLADAIGYLGSVSILLWRNFGETDLSWLRFYVQLCYLGGFIVVALSIVVSWTVWRNTRSVRWAMGGRRFL